MSPSEFLKNPMTEWLLWLVRKAALETRHRGLDLGYLAVAKGSRFGEHNSVQERTILEDVSLGNGTYVGSRSQLVHADFGHYCCIGPHVQCGLGVHPSDTFVSSHPAFYSTRGQAGIVFADGDYVAEHRRTKVGNDVWIGASVILIDGVTIGDGAIVAAGAVVTKDVEPYSIVGGMPAKTIRRRFSEPEIAFLTAFKWWDRDVAWLKANWKDFHDVRALMARHGPATP